ncbi:type II toxin-antitoxin system RelE/ParE family toxin [Jeotgalibaca caeni]|uniref:type II toxin-antitoxin system RelE/ParE family toxin n=1 Tax=Jeotgalibaca caeni TaxID=3028623 RepID=UPI00237D72E1|nr:type II toxin-antitoxin system RelE/ParE family toxin [Jeotgalibaca caeni]MDE1549299.1 type II toxin-antitoxin system RelE/ParE family toxin [Jeotgalibaca caeni]
MVKYTVEYSESFRTSLVQTIKEWETELFIPENQVNQFVQAIYKSIELIKIFPEMNEEVSLVYGFREPTYRILIGKSYAIFYRINKNENKILIGNLYKQKQMKLQF